MSQTSQGKVKSYPDPKTKDKIKKERLVKPSEAAQKDKQALDHPVIFSGQSFGSYFAMTPSRDPYSSDRTRSFSSENRSNFIPAQYSRGPSIPRYNAFPASPAISPTSADVRNVAARIKASLSTGKIFGPTQSRPAFLK